MALLRLKFVGVLLIGSFVLGLFLWHSQHSMRHKSAKFDIVTNESQTHSSQARDAVILEMEPTTQQSSYVTGSVTTSVPTAPPACDSADRLPRLRSECRKQGWRDLTVLNESATYEHILVDDMHKVLYCFIPKVACTTFKLMMVYSTLGKDLSRLAANATGSYWHNNANLAPIGIKTLDSFSEKERNYRLRDYFKFMAVRHPFDRLASAYSNKYDYRAPFYDSRGPLLQKSFLQSYLNSTDVKLTFPTFLHLVATESEQHSGGFTNIHWSSYVSRCHPCEINYDRLVRLETIDNDIPHVLPHFPDSNGNEFHLKGFNVAQSVSADEKLKRLSEQYGEIDTATIDGLLKLYEKDMKLFGYHWQKADASGSCHFRSSPNETTCC